VARVPAKAPGWAIPYVLRLPTGLFRLVAAPMLAVDGTARTSMVADLEAGRPTEIEEFQGEVLRLAAAHGLAAPVTERVRAAVKRAEAEGLRPVAPEALLAGRES
jgi:2-dehydropantoate 2-reductase